MINYYNILGVSQYCTKAEVKKAYRKLAFKYHPDTSGDSISDDKIKLINEAYSVLTDDAKRKSYDLKLSYLNNFKYRTSTNVNFNNKYRQNTYKYKPQQQKHSRHYEKRKEFKKLEKFMFSVLLFIGISGFFLACSDLYVYGFDGMERLNGFIFSILFTSLLLIVWQVKKQD